MLQSQRPGPGRKGRIPRSGAVAATAGLLCLAGVLLIHAATATAPQETALAPQPQYGRIARAVARALPRMHLEHRPVNDELASRALRLFLDTLDYDHTLFLASDIEEFEMQNSRLDDRLRDGDVSFAFEVFEIYRRRLDNRFQFIQALLEKGFDVEQAESYTWKRKTAPWAATEAEWDELWRLKIKNEYVGRVVADRLAREEAAKAAAAATNAPPAAEGAPAATNGEAAAEAPAATNAPAVTPEDFILKRYRQLVTIMNDHDSEWVLQTYLSSFAQAFDPHTEYMSASSTEDFDIGMKLSLVGIGALLTSEDGMAKIVRLIPGSPAERDGRLKPNDRIIAVAQGDDAPEDVLHWPLTRTVRLIRGEAGTKVVLTVIPASDLTGTRTEKVDLIRGEVQLEDQAAKGSVKDIKEPDGTVHRLGVISLPAFYVDIRGKMEENGDYRSSLRDVRRLLSDMETNGVEGVLIDLRNNGGGSLTEAVEMTGLFLDSGPIVQVKESRGIKILCDPDPSTVFDKPAVVLVNRQSASASEILAAALQDYGRAVIIGDSKTHGKGTVQSLVLVDDRDQGMGSLKVTTASFHRISGGSTQLKGVRPDIVISSALDSIEVGEEHLPYPLDWSMVDQALYAPQTNLAPMILELRANSARRMAQDPRFEARGRQLEWLADMQHMQDLPLRIEDRLALAEKEKALRDIEESEDSADEEKAGEEDPVLLESLRILGDMVSLQHPQGGPS